MSQLRSDFKAVLDTMGAAKVYGQGPGNTTLVYPCIMYEENLEKKDYADNVPYNITDRYLVTVIESDPDRPVAKAVRQLPLCTFNRRFEADNLIHTVYNVYF